MNGKEFSNALAARRHVYGTCHISTSPNWSAALAGAGLDFVFIDTEHTAIDRTTVAWLSRIYRSLNLAPMVRIPAPDPYQASMVIDGGAEAVLAPYIETVEQVRRLAGPLKYRPLKDERLERALDDPSTLEPELAAYLQQRNAGLSLLINIESIPGIEALDDILATGFVDGVVIGPHDLSCSLGIPEQYDHPRFEEAVRTIIGKCDARAVSAGLHTIWDAIPRQIEWARLGANILLHSVDLFLFRRALTEDLTKLKTALGDDPAGGVRSFNV